VSNELAVDSRAPAAPPAWVDLRDEELTALRICDLGVRIEGSWLQPLIRTALKELRATGLTVRPHFWLSDEWFTPDGVPGIAVPFYLAHPRLMDLERRQMLEVEGGTSEWCMRILRHELGHAVSNAYLLHRKRPWIRVFGSSAQRYPEFYHPRPYSKSFVLHLDSWYAQSHPAEDFAETFAVWLTPHSQWEKRYVGWPALKKLEFVDRLMKSLAGVPPVVRSKARVEPIRGIRKTLAEYYANKRAMYGAEYPDFYDRDLRKLFTDQPKTPGAIKAAKFLRRVRGELRRMVARWTDEYQYTIDQVIEEMIARCEELKLWMDRPEQEAKTDATVLLAVQTMNYLHSGRHRVAL
jgi:hypothetical protein